MTDAEQTHTTLMEVEDPYVGRPMLRVEDRPLLTGTGSFVDDVDRPGQLFARVVRSEVAHGRIVGIDTDTARRHEGVVAVVTAADLPDVRIPIRLAPTEDTMRALQPPLSRGAVRYVGEPLAVVVATDPYTAEDAATEVWAEIEPLPVIVDVVEGAQPDAVVLHEALGGNVFDEVRIDHGRAVDELFAEADVVIGDRFSVQRHTAAPLETRGLVAEVDAGSGVLSVWGPAKVKQYNRGLLADLLGLEPEQVRFVEPDVGGGFGVRGEFYPEDFLIPWLAVSLQRPVKWIEDRQEHFVAANHSREQTCELEIAAAADGRLLAFRARVSVDMGGYTRTHGLLLAKNTLTHLAGPYRWEGFAAAAVGVLTNKTPVGTYRGPGMFEPAFHRERLIDRVAADVGIDPAALRRANLVPVDAMPYTTFPGSDTAEEIVYDAGDFPLLWDRLLEHAGYDELQKSVAARRAAGECVGIGLAAYVEAGARGPYEWARVVPEPGGGFVVHVGIAAIGQGVATALAQIAADALRVPMDKVTISHKDTDDVPEGGGAYSSRSVVFGGNAILGAVSDLFDRARGGAADRLGIAEADVELVAGSIARERGRIEHGVTFADLGCEGRFRFEKHVRSFAMGGALVVASIDEASSQVTVERCAVACDVGRAVNPLIVDGQVCGAAAQGIGGALLEELAYDVNGQPVSTSFMDYCLPTAAELPRIEAIVMEMPQHRPQTRTPLGAKGAGEIGIVGMGAAVGNAVANALGDPAAIVSLPIAPALVAATRDRLAVRGSAANGGSP